MKTEISTDRAAAVELLRKGEIVALPTETVYGLAANALDAMAVAKIFEAKERPRFDPLIVHLPDRDWLKKIVDIPQLDQQLILELADKCLLRSFARLVGRLLRRARTGSAGSVQRLRNMFSMNSAAESL